MIISNFLGTVERPKSAVTLICCSARQFDAKATDSRLVHTSATWPIHSNGFNETILSCAAKLGDKNDAEICN